jgi:hypothetical protein
MKKILLALCALLLLAQAPMAVVPSLGAGAFGGMHFPIVQDDQGSGSTFGIRGIVQIMPSLSAEPNVTFSKYGEPDFGIVGVTNDLEGSKVTSFGVDALFGKASSVSTKSRGIRPPYSMTIVPYSGMRSASGSPHPWHPRYLSMCAAKLT